MKHIFFRFCLSLVICVTGSQLAHGYEDLDIETKVGKVVAVLVQDGILQDGAYFYPEKPVNADFMMHVLSGITGVEIIDGLKASKAYGFEYDSETSLRYEIVNHREGLTAVMKSHNIRYGRQPSLEFAEQIDRIHPSIAAQLEVAHREGIISLEEAQKFDIHAPLSRGQFMSWVRPFLLLSTLELDGIQTIEVTGDRSDGDFELGLFYDVIERLEGGYEFFGDLTPEEKSKAVEAGVTAFTEALGDRHTTYVPIEESADYLSKLDGEFEGIGAYVEMIEDDFTIVAPIKGSPAERVGLLPQDIVLEVDGESISNLSQREIIKKIKGPAGTTVLLLIKRGKEEREFTIERGAIVVPSVTFDLHQGVPVIGVHQFSGSMPEIFRDVVEQNIQGKNYKNIVIDVRNNPGGFVKTLLEVAEYFLHEGDVIFTSKSRTGDIEYASSMTGILADDIHIHVIQNSGSASASEIFAGMIQDHKKGTVYGQKSFGKGTVQTVAPMDNGGILKYTIAQWYTPGGQAINDNGVTPDVEIKADLDTKELIPAKNGEKPDPMLQEVLSMIRSR